MEFKSVNGFVLNSDGFTAPALTIAGAVRVFDEIGSPFSNVPIYGIAFSQGFFTQSTVRIEAGGSLTVEHFNGVGHASGFETSGRSADFFNAGLLKVSASQDATGLLTYHDGPFGAEFDFENSGTIEVSAPFLVQGVWIANGGNFTNSGLIEVTGGVDVNGQSLAVRLEGFGSSFLNTGTIRAVGGNPGNPSVALTWNSTMDAGQTFRNTGVLQGDYALIERPWSSLVPNQSWEFVNAGQMIGKVRMGQVNERLINNGLITGTVDLGFGDDLFDGRNGVQLGVVSGELGADSIVGGIGAETLSGGDGADTIIGGSGADLILGGDGQDLLSGGQGGDLFLVEGLHSALSAGEIDRISDWGPDDQLQFGALTGLTQAGPVARISAADMASALSQARGLIGGGTAGYVAAQVGGDLVVFGATEAVTLAGRSQQDLADSQIVRVSAPPPATVGTPGADDLSLSQGPDTYNGVGGDDHIFGLDGADLVMGGDGDDVVSGGGGDDRVDGGSGNDTVYGDLGNDTLTDTGGSNYMRGVEGNDSISGGSGFDDINGNMGDDTASGGLGDDWVVGGKDNDLLLGDSGGDVVWGNLGNDTCDGGDGNDQVRGGQGDDSVSGGAGNDFVSGDRGNDTITGGAGADLFHGSQDAGIDRALDFSTAQGDRVFLDPGTTYSVSQVGADTVIDMGGGNQMILVGVTLSGLPAGWIFGA